MKGIITIVFSEKTIRSCLNYRINIFKINFDELFNNNTVRNENESVIAKSFSIELQQLIIQMSIFILISKLVFVVMHKN